VLSLAAGVGSLVLIVTGRYRLVRVTAALAVAAVLWAWGAAQYPVLLAPDLTVARAAGDPTVLATVLVVLGVGAVLLVPSLLWLFGIFQRTATDGGHGHPSRRP
jgi:cytochrome d ubiquinol oxidase subunit II